MPKAKLTCAVGCGLLLLLRLLGQGNWLLPTQRLHDVLLLQRVLRLQLILLLCWLLLPRLQGRA